MVFIQSPNGKYAKYVLSLYTLPTANSTIPMSISARSKALARRLRSPKSSAPHVNVTITDERRIIDTIAIIEPSLSSAL